MNLYRFEVFKLSTVWNDIPEWRNWYIYDMDATANSLSEVARSMAAMERTMHQEHIMFTRVVCQPADNDTGDQYAQDESGTTVETLFTRVFHIQPEFQFGVLPNDYEGAEHLQLRVSKDRQGMRNGYTWYRGALGLGDVVVGYKGETVLNDMHWWRARFNDYYGFYFAYDWSAFYVQRTGQNKIKFGDFTSVERITVRGVTLSNGIDRAKKRVPQWRYAAYAEIAQNTAFMSETYALFKSWQFLGTDFNPTFLQSAADEIMSFALNISSWALIALQHNQQNECTQGLTYNTRFGPTSEQLLAVILQTLAGDCEEYRPNEGYVAQYSAIIDMEPEIDFAGVQYYSLAQLDEMEGIFLLYLYCAYELCRGDWLPSNPRSWPPIPVA